MAELDRDVLIIGAGVAGASCAKELREQGYDGSVMLVGREMDAPYERPPATKYYLAGEMERDEATWLSADWCEEHDVELRLRTSVMKVDLEAREAKLQGGDVVRFGHLVMATGANVRRLRIDGTDLEGIHYIRALRNADSIRAELPQTEQAVVIGGSFLACETAATLTGQGKTVTLVMQESEPFENTFGARVGKYVRSVLEGNGVTVIGGKDVEKLEGAEERVERVVCSDGTTAEGQLVVMGVGAQPDVMAAKSMGLELGESGGILADAKLAVSGQDRVWAAGDCAEFHSELYDRRLRIEHHEVAVGHGKAVAKNIAGADEPYGEVPFFWSDLSDWMGLQFVGSVAMGPGETLYRGDVEGGAFSAWYFAGGTLVGALSIGADEDLPEARRLIEDRAKLDDIRETVENADAELSEV